MCRRGLCLLLLLTGLAHAQTTLTIAAAADLQPVLPSLLAEYRQQTGETVEATYGSSATLATQILNGAPFGLFLSADMSFAQKVNEGAPVPYARGTLVLWARNDSPAQPLSLDVLRKPALRTVAVANAEHAPYGRAARAAIEKLGLADVLKEKLVIGENIAQTATFAESGNAQAGFLSLTSALTPRLRGEGSYVVVPRDTYPPLLQGAVVLKPGGAAARRFLTFLLSPPVRHELAERGLAAP